MSSPESMHVSFRHQDIDYHIQLVKGVKSDNSVTINGVTYAVLGDKEKNQTACEILHSISLHNIANSNDLKDRLSSRSDISFPYQKTEEIGVRALQTQSPEHEFRLAAHVVQSESYGMPQTLKENFQLLWQNKVITASLKEKMERMVGFRNIAVQDLEEFYTVLINQLKLQ